MPAPPNLDPDITTEVPAPRVDPVISDSANPGLETGRRAETSQAPQAPRGNSTTGDLDAPAPFDPARTGEHTPTSQNDGDFSTDAPMKANPRRAPNVPGYQVVGELGRGGMGVVYEAVQEGLGRHVALKMILSGAHASDLMIARFVAEAQAVARFQHPNIVQVFEVGEHERLPYFSLEYVDGGTLAHKVKKEPQPPRYAAAIVEQLARAMQYAHDRGIVHRDLKPANILLTKDGLPKITDFGLAKVLEQDSGNTQSGQVLGTPSYMAPEQARGDTEHIGKPADVYALGAILYDLLTGRPPFAGSSLLDTLEMVRTREPVAPSELTGKLPRDIETICLKCLQKEAAKRYASAAEMADDLRRYLEGRPILARPIGKVERAYRWAKRNPVGAVAVALAVAVLVVPSILSGLLFVAEAKATGSANRANEEKVKAESERDEKEKARAAEEVAKVRAIDEEKKAVAARDLARQRLGIALDTARGGLLTIDDLMRNKLTLAPLRLTIIKAILKDLDKIRATVDTDPLIDRNEAIAYSRIADIYLRANQIQDAALWHRKAYEVLKVLANANREEIVSVRNLAASGNQLAEVEWRLGNGSRARELYAEGLKLRQKRLELVERLNNPPALNEAREDIAASHGLIAFADLRLGNVESAAEHYLASDEVYAQLRTKGTLPVRRFRAEIQLRLGDIRLWQNQREESLKHYRAALTERETLLKITPVPEYAAPLKGDIAHSRIYLGDYYLVTHDIEKAIAEHSQALAIFLALSNGDKENLAYQERVAAVRYRLGVELERHSAAAAVAGWPLGIGRATQHLTEALQIREQIARIDSRDARAKIDVMLTLGRLGRAEEAEKLARELLALKEPDSALRFQTACGLAVAAGDASSAAVAGRCRDRAFQVLDDLIKGGWKVTGLLATEPDLDSLRNDPRFLALVAAAKLGKP